MNKFALLLATGALQPWTRGSFGVLAESNLCHEADAFIYSNATRSYSMPALQINRTEEEQESFQLHVGSLITDPSKSWYISSRVDLPPGSDNDEAKQHFWINTGDSNTTKIGMCVQNTLPAIFTGEYAFSKEVLQRSVEDNGDCKVMLGEECVSALERHWRQQATLSITNGQCPEASRYNNTVPWPCAGLVNGAESWNGEGLYSSVNLSHAFTQQTLAEEKCDNTTKPLNASMHPGIGIGGGYDQTIRFPSPWFMTFWPNRTGVDFFDSSWVEDVHVEVRCLRPDEIAEGSTVPPTAQELLSREDIKFHKNATTPNVAAMGSVPVYLGAGAAWLAALFLV